MYTTFVPCKRFLLFLHHPIWIDRRLIKNPQALKEKSLFFLLPQHQKKKNAGSVKKPFKRSEFVIIMRNFKVLLFLWAVHPSESNGGSIRKYHEVSMGKYCEVLNWWDPHQHLVNCSYGWNIKMLDTSQYYTILLNTSQYYKRTVKKSLS
jgi:hypothetical protein